MPIQQRVVIISVACFLVLVIFELVRKRRLREEYSWLWLVAGGLVFCMAFVPYEGLVILSQQMGSNYPPSAIFFLGFCAMTLLCLQFSVRLSRMTEQVKS